MTDTEAAPAKQPTPKSKNVQIPREIWIAMRASIKAARTDGQAGAVLSSDTMIMLDLAYEAVLELMEQRSRL